MLTPFLSSEEYDERAHALYNDGQYDDALELLREGLERYPNAVELRVGVAYAQLAREEFAWARRSFEAALVLDPDHEDALAGLGEILLKLGHVDEGLRMLQRTVELGYDEDIDLMVQIGRALFREGFVEEALSFFERGLEHTPDSAEAMACKSYAQHRLGHEAQAIASLQRALALDADFTEARVYLANLLYDTGDMEGAKREYDLTTPEDHWDELGIWRLTELKKSAEQLVDGDPALRIWEARLAEIAEPPDSIDELLAEIEQRVMERESDELAEANEHEQTGTDIGALFADRDASSVGEMASHGAAEESTQDDGAHHVIMSDGSAWVGTWEEIVRALRDSRDVGRSPEEYMAREARRYYGATGRSIATHAAEAFLRDGADAGLLRIVR